MKPAISFLTFAGVLEILVKHTSAASYHVKIHKSGAFVGHRGQAFAGHGHDVNVGKGLCTILSDVEIKKYRGLKSEKEVHINTRPATQIPDEPGEPFDESTIVEIFGNDRSIIQNHIDTMCKVIKRIEPLGSKYNSIQQSDSLTDEPDLNFTLNGPEQLLLVGSIVKKMTSSLGLYQNWPLVVQDLLGVGFNFGLNGLARNANGPVMEFWISDTLKKWTDLKEKTATLSALVECLKERGCERAAGALIKRADEIRALASQN